jgi:peroxiredoxin
MASKKITIGLYVLLGVMGVANILLVRQNLQLRRSIEGTRPERLAVGDKVPSFTAVGLSGESINVAYNSQEQDKLLFFFTPSCPFSRQQFPGWLDLVKRTDKRKVEVIGLAADAEDTVKLREYLHEVSSTHPPGITFPTAIVSKEVRRKYKLSETPLTLLIASDGTVKEVWAGKWDSKVLATVTKVIGVTGK